MSGYSHSMLKKGTGKGIGSYFKIDKFELRDKSESEKFQIAKFSNEVLDVLSIYRSQGLNSAQLLDEITKRIDKKRVTLIMGDFNLCYYENQRNKLIQGLINLGFTQLMHEPTHIRGRIIDHAYFLDLSNLMHLTCERYSPYYSDHDALCICIEGYTTRIAEC